MLSMTKRRSTVFEEQLRQENAWLRILLRWAARILPTEASNKIIEELDGLPRHRRRSTVGEKEHLEGK